MLLFVVVSVLTVLLVGVGIQTFFVLRDIRKTIAKFNKVLDNVGVLSNSITRPVVGITNFIESIKHVGDLVDFILQKRSRSESLEETKVPEPEPLSESLVTSSYEGREFEEETRHPAVAALQERGRRFFHRDGKPLTS